MYATAWHNGSRPDEPAGYGLKFSKTDRNKYFDRDWNAVVLELDDGPSVTVDLTPSFWRTCSELRSAKVGRWLLDNGVAPWSSGSPPAIIVTPAADNRFSARVHRRKQLPAR